jgi:hypothetical protein
LHLLKLHNQYLKKRGHSPLVVIGGDAGIKYQAMDVLIAGDLVPFAKVVSDEKSPRYSKLQVYEVQ